MERMLRLTALQHFSYRETEPGFVFPGESHTALELIYVDQGTMHSVADGKDLTVSQGQWVFYGENQWHMQYAHMDMAPRFVSMIFTVSGGDFTALQGHVFTAPQAAASLLRQMVRELEQPGAYSQDFVAAALELLLIQLLRNVDAPAQKVKTAHALRSENEIIQRAQQYVQSHVRSRLSVPQVARNADVSPSYLTALFHKHLQISPGEYIRRVKLQESKMLIREGKMNFTEIAAALQYSTVHHFSRQFKEKFGMTPTEYARSLR